MGMLVDLLFGAIGSAYVIYGRKQYNVPFLVAGFVLAIYPWFVSNIVVCSLIGVIFCAAPFVVRKLME